MSEITGNRTTTSGTVITTTNQQLTGHTHLLVRNKEEKFKHYYNHY